MRLAPMLRTTAIIAALGAAGAGDLGAQKRTFENSWFWGVRAGGTLFSTRRMQDVAAPGAGLDFLITRKRGALNVHASQYFFETLGAIDDPTNSGATRTVALKDMRTVGASIMGFPRAYGVLRPYAGIGFNFNLIQQAAVTGAFTTPQQRDSVMARVQGARTGVLPVFTLGTQMHLGGSLNIFAQGGASPGRPSFVFDNGSSYTFEGGIRYNIGSARERN